MVTIFLLHLTMNMTNILLCHFNTLNNMALCSPLDITK
jgi:hypothetical protein